jgi:GxxExxY protein
MKENDISDRILDCCFKVHRNLGPGLFESVYEEILALEMSNKHLHFERQKALSLKYGDIKLDVAFRSDFIVEYKVIVELKSVEKVLPVHKKQLLTYLKIAHCKLGLLINFNTELLKNGIHRVVNDL